MRKFIIVTAVLTAALSMLNPGTSRATPPSYGEQPVQTGQPDHSGLNRLLTRHSRGGLVDYAGMKDDSGLLLRYIEGLRDSSALYYVEWDRSTQMAFWINAYNAITIYAIITSYPIEFGGLLSRMRFPKSSIRQIKNVWDTAYFELAGSPYTLDEIEHEILRVKFADPRIHFTLVCASKGCPQLAGKAYSGEDLEERLEMDTARFINDRDKVWIDEASNQLLVSAIFKWYAEDFKASETPDWLMSWDEDERGVAEFITRYVQQDSRSYIMTKHPEIEYLDYDWSLNELVESP